VAGTITALKALKRAKDRVAVHLDGEYAFSLALIHALWLKIGQPLSDDDITALRAADTLEQAQQRAVGLIAYRPRSVREVRQRLKKAGAEPATIEDVVGRLKSAGLLDDEAFSQAWVESRLRANPRGKRLIAYELRMKGVSDADIATALTGVDDADAALRAAQKRWPRLKSLPARDRKRKLSDFLARNGFDYNTIEDTLRKIERVDDDTDDSIRPDE
jgi:regulatory protein